MFQNLCYKLQRKRLSDVLPHPANSSKVTQNIFRAIGGLHKDKFCNILQGMAPTSVKTVHQASLFHIESNPDRLRLLSPTQGQRSQQQSGQITLQSIFSTRPRFSRQRRAETREIVVPRSMVAEGLSRWSWRVSKQSLVQSSKHPGNTPQQSCSYAAPCWLSQEEKTPCSEMSFPLKNL